MGNLIGYLNNRSLLILAASIFIGFFVPAVAAAARPALSVAVAIFLFGTFVRVDASELKDSILNARVAVWFPLAIMVVTPLALVAGASLLPIDPELVAALGLAALCPPSTGNVAVARKVEGDHSASLAIIIISTAMAPLTIPILANLLVDQEISSAILSRNIALLVLGPASLAGMLLLWKGDLVQRSGSALDLVTIAGLAVFGVATMDGVLDEVRSDPNQALRTVGIVVAVSLVLQLIGAVGGRGPVRRRVGFGFVVGNRNVGLIWAAAGSALSPTVTLYFALYQLPFFVFPAIIERALGRPMPERDNPPNQM